MTSTPIRHALRILVLCLFICALSPTRSVGVPPTGEETHRVNLEALASTLTSRMRNAGVSSATVADFLATDGRRTDLTWYLSGKLSDALRKDIAENNGPRFVNRGALADSKITVEEMNSREALVRLGTVWGVVAIVTGTVEIFPDKYVVKAVVRTVADGSSLASASQDVSRLHILELLLPGGAIHEGSPTKTVGADGVSTPICQFCPIPHYSEVARAAGIQTAKVILTVTVSAKGQVVKLSLTKDPGFGFGENAIEDVSGWKFQPAMQNGKPVTVAVPVEVEFSTART